MDNSGDLSDSYALDFDLCSSKAKIKDSIQRYFMAAEMMNGGLFQPNEPAVSLPWILIAEVASHCSEFNGKQTFQKVWRWSFGEKKRKENEIRVL